MQNLLSSLLLRAHSGPGHHWLWDFFGLILLLAAHSGSHDGSHIPQASAGDQPGGQAEPLGQENVLSLPSQQLHQHLTHLVLTQQHWQHLLVPLGPSPARPWGVPGHCSLLTPFQQNKGEQERSKSMLGVKLDYARVAWILYNHCHDQTQFNTG